MQVRAEAGVGTGPWSPSASIKAGLPEVPSDIGLESGNDTLVVTWTVPSGNGSTLTGYDFRYSSDSGTNWTEVSLSTVPPNPSHSLSGLSNGTTYQVQVRAKNQHGVGPWSDSGTETPGKPSAPGAPTLTAADHKFLVGWSAATDNGSAISDYDVRYKKSSASNWSEIDDTSDSTDRSVVLTGLEPTETYQVQVRATNTHGDSAWSASSTLKLPVSAVPQLFGVRYCDPAALNQVWVDYDCFIKPGQHGTKPFDAARIASGGDYVELYDYIDSAQTVVALGYNPQGGLAIVETTLGGVVQDTFQIDVIRFSIREVTVTPKTNATGTLTVRLHSPSHGSPDIYEKNGVDYARSWVELSLPGGLRGQSHGSTNLTRTPFQFVGQFGDTITFDLFVLSGGDYTITVNAYRPEPDPDCTGALKCFTPPDPQTQLQYETSVTAQATFAAPNPPAAPTGLTASASDGSITLSWDDPQNPTISGYEYNVNHNDTGTGNLSGWSDWQSIDGSNAQTTSHTFSGLTNGREYRFHVRAVNAGGAGTGGPNAAPWYVAATPEEPPDPPAAPASVSVTRADGTLTASWDAPTGATGYEIKYSDDGGSSWQTAAPDHTETSIAINVTNSSTYIVAVRARQRGRLERLAQLVARGPVRPAADQPAQHRRLSQRHPHRRLPHRRLGRARRRNQIPRHLHRRRRQELARAGGRSHERAHQQPHVQRRQRQDLRHRRPRRQQHGLERVAQLAILRPLHPTQHTPDQSARPGLRIQRHPRRRNPDRQLGRPRRREQVPRHLQRRRRQELARAHRQPHQCPHQQPQLQRRQRQDLHHRRASRQRDRLERLAQLPRIGAVHALVRRVRPRSAAPRTAPARASNLLTDQTRAVRVGIASPFEQVADRSNLDCRRVTTACVRAWDRRTVCSSTACDVASRDTESLWPIAPTPPGAPYAAPASSNRRPSATPSWYARGETFKGSAPTNSRHMNLQCVAQHVDQHLARKRVLDDVELAPPR